MRFTEHASAYLNLPGSGYALVGDNRLAALDDALVTASARGGRDRPFVVEACEDQDGLHLVAVRYSGETADEFGRRGLRFGVGIALDEARTAALGGSVGALRVVAQPLAEAAAALLATHELTASEKRFAAAWDRIVAGLEAGIQASIAGREKRASPVFSGIGWLLVMGPLQLALILVLLLQIRAAALN